MDNTLTMLYSSSQSRGLPHELTRNISSLVDNNIKWSQRHYYSALKTWKPQLPPDSEEYIPKPVIPTTQKGRNKAEKERRQKEFDRNAWGALGEVVRMAEGRDGLCLGRATFNERRA